MKRMLAITGVAILAISGGLISRYLFYKHLHAGGPDLCSAVFGSSCNGALTSSFAEVFGLPLGGWGMLYYFVLGLLFLVPRLFGKAFLPGSRFLIFTVTFCSVVTGLFFTGLMLRHPAMFCPLCSLVHGINFLLFFLLIKINRYGFPQFFSSFSSRKPVNAGPGRFWKPFGFLVAFFFVLSAFWGLKALALSVAAAQKVDFKAVLADYDQQLVRKIPLLREDAMAGNPSGLMTLVIFTDFYCPVCRVLSAETETIVKEFGKECLVVFKQFPLNTDCNHFIDKNVHTGACEAALAGLAAAQQGKFIEYHRIWLNSNSTETISPVEVARKCGLQIQAFDLFRESPLAETVLQADIRQGAELGIEGTPTVFLNGRQIKDTRPGVVRSVLMRELQARARKAPAQ
ncbi:vitamin K epoxide reductase family protein [Niabella sp.]|uniref:DsbA family protein n=1 Tax=Niabella sp. TaxID=1962976 RepID=UPI002616C15C|nr:vitamin K epoxide reductase family protein [Niabella sp.]